MALIPISSACTLLLKTSFENIVISSKVEEVTFKPLDEKTVFESSAENIYATIHYTNVKGDDSYRFKWTYLDTGEIILDAEGQYAKDLKGTYVSGNLMTKIDPQLFKLKIIASGDYKVDFYHKGEIIKTTTFKVTGTTAETAAETTEAAVTTETVEAVVTFNDENTFTEAQDKYFFTIKYPDTWEYVFTEDATGMNVGFKSLNKDEAFATTMAVINDASGIKESDYLAAADEFAKAVMQAISGELQQTGDTQISDRTLLDGSPFKEYIYYYNDTSASDKGEFATIIDLIPKFGKLYIWIGMAPKIFYTQLDTAYLEGLKSLVLEE
jgi:hypothetical protein